MTDLNSLRSPETATKSVVLVVEDDQQVQRFLKSELERIGFDVLLASGEEDVRRLVRDPKYDVVVLDLAIDGEPYKGFDVVQVIRSNRSVPILVVSGHAQPSDRLRALEMGIDDYITKPFLMKEVEIRLRRALKLYGSEMSQGEIPDHVLEFAGFRLDPVRLKVETLDAVEIILTETEFSILKYLLGASGRIVTRSELWRALRGQAWSPVDRAIDGHVARLRAKLEPGVERPQIIKSVRGIGYVIAVPVSRIHPSAAL